MNSKILELREKLNTSDQELVELLKKRFNICGQIGKTKKQNNIPVEDLGREKQIIESEINLGGLDKDFVKELFELIFKQSKKLQYE